MFPVSPFRPHPHADLRVQRQRGHGQPFQYAVTHVFALRTVLPNTLGGQQQFQRYALARHGTVRIPHRHAPAGHLMTFGPGLAIGGSSFADAMEGGDEGVRIGRRCLV